MAKLPERIYLQWDGEVEGTTWCLDQINDEDGVYVLESRAEAAEQQLAEQEIAADVFSKGLDEKALTVARLESQLAEAREIMDGIFYGWLRAQYPSEQQLRKLAAVLKEEGK